MILKQLSFNKYQNCILIIHIIKFDKFCAYNDSNALAT